MRKLKCFQVPGLTVGELLDEFNERAEEFGITSEHDIVTVSALPYRGTSEAHKVEVVIVYWEN